MEELIDLKELLKDVPTEFFHNLLIREIEDETYEMYEDFENIMDKLIKENFDCSIRLKLACIISFRFIDFVTRDLLIIYHEKIMLSLKPEDNHKLEKYLRLYSDIVEDSIDKSEAIFIKTHEVCKIMDKYPSINYIEYCHNIYKKNFLKFDKNDSFSEVIEKIIEDKIEDKIKKQNSF